MTALEHENRIERLEAMVSPGQQVWELSPLDVAAIRHALDYIKALEASNAVLRKDLLLKEIGGAA